MAQSAPVAGAAAHATTKRAAESYGGPTIITRGIQMRNASRTFVALLGVAMAAASLAQTPAAAPAPATPATAAPAASPAAAPAKASDGMEGLAAVYSDRLAGRKTASGEAFSQGKLTAAHPSLAFGTKVRVTNTKNNKTVEVRINDRGPRRLAGSSTCRYCCQDRNRQEANDAGETRGRRRGAC